MRFLWKGLDGVVMLVEVLPGDGTRYRTTRDGLQSEGTTTLGQLRTWYEAREVGADVRGS